MSQILPRKYPKNVFIVYLNLKFNCGPLYLPRSRIQVDISLCVAHSVFSSLLVVKQGLRQRITEMLTQSSDITVSG